MNISDPELTRSPRADDLTSGLLIQAWKGQTFEQLACGIVHDFNNHLTGIVGCLMMMKAEIAREDLNGVERYIDAAQGAAQRATSLTRRLLNFSRQSAESASLTAIDDLVQGMEVLIRLAVAQSVVVKVNIDQGAGASFVDPCQLENSVLNLCINARDAMPAGGVVTVATWNEDVADGAAVAIPPGRYVCLSVSDTGSGISTENLARVCEPFFTTKASGSGTGLGLSIIREFVRQSGGHLRIASQLGQGTAVSLYLPRWSTAAEGQDPAENA